MADFNLKWLDKWTKDAPQKPVKPKRPEHGKKKG